MRLVVAQYQEDVSWVSQYPAWEPLIVQKEVDIPNVGREPASFFWAMEKLYGTNETIAFVQGNPFAHAPQMVLSSVDEFRWLGNPTYIADVDGGPHHYGLPVRERLREWCEQDWTERIFFAAGGQFLLPGHQLRKWPKEKYAGMREAMSVGENPWVMERLWERFFA